VPSTEGPSVALGALQSVSLRRIDSFDARLREGVHFLEPNERRDLCRLSRNTSIDENEIEAQVTRQQREASLNEDSEGGSEGGGAGGNVGGGDADCDSLFSSIGPALGQEPSLSDLFG
jgi:hypothetical protein